MAKKRALPPGTPEYAVDQETLMQFFCPPVSQSTFYKLQKDGFIVPVEGVSGRYRLNLSLVRMGLETVDKLPQPDGDPAYNERLTQLAVSYASHAAGGPVDPPTWTVTQEPSAEMEQQAFLLALLFFCDLRKLEYPFERESYVRGVLEAAHLGTELHKGFKPDPSSVEDHDLEGLELWIEEFSTPPGQAAS